jgi:serine/threonine protein kinase
MHCKQIGGGFVGEGGFGCVFRPPLGTDKDKNHIGKVFDNKDVFDKENEIDNIVKKIDPQSKFTVKQFSADKVRKELITKEDEMSKCTTLVKAPGIPLYQIIYAYGGVDLQEKSLFEKTFKSQAMLYNLFSNVFKGVKIIKDKGYVHNDIKPENMLYDKKGNRINIIDFGLVTGKETLFTKEQLNRASFSYIYYPPEYKLYAILNTKPGNQTILSRQELTLRLYNEYIKNIKQSTEAKLKLLFNIDVYDEIKKFVHENYTKIISTKSHLLFNQFRDKADVYSLGMTMLSCYLKMVRNETKMGKAVHVEVLGLIRAMIHPNPLKRYTIEEAIEHLEKGVLGKKTFTTDLEEPKKKFSIKDLFIRQRGAKKMFYNSTKKGGKKISKK